MIRYLIRRLLWAVVLFVAITIITYIIFFMIPTDPARKACGQLVTPACVKSARHYLGLDRPVYIQYYKFLERLVVHQSLGRSFANRQNINSIIGRAAPITASLVFGGAITWLLLAIPIVLALTARFVRLQVFVLAFSLTLITTPGIAPASP